MNSTEALNKEMIKRDLTKNSDLTPLTVSNTVIGSGDLPVSKGGETED
jgi:hypothetical protein